MLNLLRKKFGIHSSSVKSIKRDIEYGKLLSEGIAEGIKTIDDTVFIESQKALKEYAKNMHKIFPPTI